MSERKKRFLVEDWVFVFRVEIWLCVCFVVVNKKRNFSHG